MARRIVPCSWIWQGKGQQLASLPSLKVKLGEPMRNSHTVLLPSVAGEQSWMNARKGAFICVLVLIFSLFVTSTAKADELYGRVRGTVTDASGAVLPDATVKITNPANGFTKEVTSGKDGNFELINLPPAVYSLTAT